MKNVLITSVSSALTTALVLILLVLPIAYEIDLSGLGKVLGINGLLKPIKPLAENSLNKRTAPIQSNVQPAVHSQLTVNESIGEVGAARQESFKLTVPANQNLSFQFYMERDYDLTYYWATESKPLYCELRGQNTTAKEPNTKVFGKLTESRAKGFFIPPFTGNYSLYWENRSDKPVSIRLTAKGVYKPLS